MNNKVKRIAAALFALVIALSAVLTLGGCSDDGGFTGGTKVDYVEPTDNDYEGWFSVEVLFEYSAAGFAQPRNTEVVSKPERNTLYLKGDENTLIDTAKMAFSSIMPVNSATYVPVYTINDSGVAEVADLRKVDIVDYDELYPLGDDTSFVIYYLAGHTLYECSVTLEISPESEDGLVCVSFKDRTELYGHLA